MSKKDRVLKIEESYEIEEADGERSDSDNAFWDEFSKVEGAEILDETVNNPVTIIIKDEKTGKAKRLPHVRNVLMFFQTTTDESSWAQLVVGDIQKISEVIAFLSKASSSAILRIFSNFKRRN